MVCAELTELEALRASAQSPYVQSVLDDRIAVVRATSSDEHNPKVSSDGTGGSVSAVETSIVHPEPATVSAAEVTEATRAVAAPETTISQFAWDQSEKFVSVYVSAPPGSTGWKDENVSCEFTDRSFSLRVSTVEGKAYKLRIDLCESIDVSQSRCKTKQARITVLCRKGDAMWWKELRGQSGGKSTEQGRSTAPEAADGADGEGTEQLLAGVLRDMYANGDDETRAAIEKTWKERVVDKGLADEYAFMKP